MSASPDNCFTVAGFWQPDKALLGAFRDAIVESPDRFRTVMSDLGGLELLEYGGMLKRQPRGYAVEDEEVAEYIRHKSFIVSVPFPDEKLMDPDFTGALIEAASQMRPMLTWGWEIQDSLKSK